MPVLKIFNWSQKGDTIVEVLIAMAVVSSVLGLSYGAMNRNLLIIRDAQERTEATKLAQGQIEALRQIATLPPVNTNFCIKSDSSVQTLTGVPDTSSNGMASDDFTKYTGQCTSGFYHIGLTSSDQKNYKIYVRWDRVTGSSRDQVIMVYRL